MKTAYLDCISMLERLHRRFLDVVRIELERLGVEDINNVQALILFNIGEEEFTVGELTQRGYYLGTNVSYNLKKLVDSGYVAHARSARDRRSVRVRLTDKGQKLRRAVDAAFDRHVAVLEGEKLDRESFVQISSTLREVERVWTTLLVAGTTRLPEDVKAA